MNLLWLLLLNAVPNDWHLATRFEDNSHIYYVGTTKADDNDAFNKAFHSATRQLLLENFSNEIKLEEKTVEDLNSLTFKGQIVLKSDIEQLEGLKVLKQEIIESTVKVLIAYPKNKLKVKSKNNKVVIISDVYPINLTFYNSKYNTSYTVKQQNSYLRLDNPWDFVTISTSNGCEITKVLKDRKISRLKFSSFDCQAFPPKSANNTLYRVKTSKFPAKITLFSKGDNYISIITSPYSELRLNNAYTSYEIVFSNGEKQYGLVDHSGISPQINIDFQDLK
jgi:hypothetical protein